MLAASAFKGYIDNQPYLVDMRVRLLQQTRNDKIDHVLYYYTPEEIVSIKKVDTDLPTDKRHALDMSRKTASTYFMVPHSAQSVNEQKLHIAPPQKSELIQEGHRLLKSGQMVSDELLSAMGVTQRQAKSIVNAARTNTSTPVPATSQADYTPYLEQLKQAQWNRKIRDLQSAYQKFLQSEQGTQKEAFAKQSKNDIINSFEIGKSLGAKAKNYEVMDLETGDFFSFSEGTKVQNVEVFAGKGSKNEFRKAQKYSDRHGGRAEDWQHVKGIGYLHTEDGDRQAEVHWSQCQGVGKVDFFVKRWLD